MNTKKLITPFVVLLALIYVSESFAQGRPSSGRTSPRTGSSSSSGSSYSGGSSSSSGSSYSGSSSSGGSSRSSGSSYGRGSSGSSGSSSSYGSDYTYTPSRRRHAAPSNRRVAPSSMQNRAPHEPIRSGQVRNMRHYSSSTYKPTPHRPANFERVPTRIRYQVARDYHQRVRRPHIYIRWVFEPAPYRYTDGYWYYNDYDWYVYQGYRYRYSDEDKCHYELVDTRFNTVVKEFMGICKWAYDSCAAERDELSKNPDYYDLKDYYICAEKVDEDLANETVQELPSLTSALPKETVQELSSFVANNSFGQLFKLGRDGLNKCSIEKAPRSSNRCNHVVKVDGRAYPDESACSNIDTSARYGCSTSSQKSNAGCLLSIAIMEGLCLDEEGKL